jgi:hypothetical protein
VIKGAYAGEGSVVMTVMDRVQRYERDRKEQPDINLMKQFKQDLSDLKDRYPKGCGFIQHVIKKHEYDIQSQLQKGVISKGWSVVQLDKLSRAFEVAAKLDCVSRFNQVLMECYHLDSMPEEVEQFINDYKSLDEKQLTIDAAVDKKNHMLADMAFVLSQQLSSSVHDAWEDDSDTVLSIPVDPIPTNSIVNRFKMELWAQKKSAQITEDSPENLKPSVRPRGAGCC